MGSSHGPRPVFSHEPVLLAEVLELLAVKPGGHYIDGTLGLGGHSSEILRRSAPDGLLLGIDRDPAALALAAARLAEFGDRVRLQRARYSEIPQYTPAGGADGVLLDLGVSSLQLYDAGRGFSFRAGGPLDMRMDDRDETTAGDVVNRMREAELADVIYELGEDRASRRIARAIARAREKAFITTTAELADIVRRAIRGRPGGIDPATRTFQALRIYVNDELGQLSGSLRPIAETLKERGRLAVISFHSLEDRIVKHTFADLAREGFRLLTKKPVSPTEEEARRNPRSRSAKLRAIERLSAKEAA
jgi:16S rRNA (cytosine1402-N4)-methyltransferase